MSKRGIFITLEGGDACGKTTQAKLLSDYFIKKGRHTILTREPGGSDLGMEIRHLLLHHNSSLVPKAEALLYAADRAHNITSIVSPALREGKIVIQDRYIDSSVAYQGSGRILGEEEIRNLSNWATDALEPDITIFLDLKPEIALERLKNNNNNSLDKLESETIDFHHRVYAAYHRFALNNEKWITIDASKSISEINLDIISAVEYKMQLK